MLNVFKERTMQLGLRQCDEVRKLAPKPVFINQEPNERKSMIFKNSSQYTDHVVRRVISFCCHELEHPVRQISEVTVRKSARVTYRGRAYWPSRRMTLTVGIGTDLEVLVRICAHEIGHLSAWHAEQRGVARTRRYGKSTGGSELVVKQWAEMVVQTFRKCRLALGMEWFDPPAKRAAKSKLSLQEQRHAKALKALQTWERKAKLAKTKIKKYRTRVRYYEWTAAGKKA